jgi:hypothetical protein
MSATAPSILTSSWPAIGARVRSPYGGLAANALGTIACIKQGEVATSFFDASADWADALYAKVADDGKFAPATEASGLSGVTVKSSPTAGSPFLVLELNIG